VVVDYATFRRALGATDPDGGAGERFKFTPAGPRCEILDGAAVPLATVQRLACDDWITRLVFDPAGEILEQGRRTRLFSSAQRRAIRVRDGGCVFPGCDRPPEWCDVHHLVPWSQGGPTDITNGAALCRGHHRLVHEGGWVLWLDEQGSWHAEPAPP
jgi:hypothetical protein